jgi:hypothetical protein
MAMTGKPAQIRRFDELAERAFASGGSDKPILA